MAAIPGTDLKALTTASQFTTVHRIRSIFLPGVCISEESGAIMK